MSNIKSQYQGKFKSETKDHKIESKTVSNYTSKTEIHVDSNIEEAAEREAFLMTSKRNAAIMFAKDL